VISNVASHKVTPLQEERGLDGSHLRVGRWGDPHGVQQSAQSVRGLCRTLHSTKSRVLSIDSTRTLAWSLPVHGRRKWELASIDLPSREGRKLHELKIAN
jgi:hypothetical protein